jgi:hypothetical protein
VTLRLLKIVMQPVVIEIDDNGDFVGEKVGGTVDLFRTDQFEGFVRALLEQIERENSGAANAPSDGEVTRP